MRQSDAYGSTEAPPGNWRRLPTVSNTFDSVVANHTFSIADNQVILVSDARTEEWTIHHLLGMRK